MGGFSHPGRFGCADANLPTSAFALVLRWNQRPRNEAAVVSQRREKAFAFNGRRYGVCRSKTLMLRTSHSLSSFPASRSTAEFDQTIGCIIYWRPQMTSAAPANG
jgi:hypothetical protein